MTDCEKIVESLSAYYDGELSADELELVREHLDTCKSCAALLRLFEDMSGAIDDAEPPQELRAGVMKAVLETDATPTRIVNLRRTALRRIIPVAACLALLLIALPLLRSIGSKDAASDVNQMSMISGTVSNESAMMPAPSAESDADSYMYGEMMEDFIAEPSVLDGGTYDAASGAGAEIEASTEPWSPDGLPPTEGTVPPQTPNPVETTAPQSANDAPTEYHGYAASRGVDYSVYYAVIKVTGDFPSTVQENMDENTAISVDLTSGEQSVIVSRDVADALIAEGYDHILYSPDADEAVVILSPDSR